MNLTCAQMDVLISFYIDDELSSVLKKQVEEHLKNCATLLLNERIALFMCDIFVYIKQKVATQKQQLSNCDLFWSASVSSLAISVFAF